LFFLTAKSQTEDRIKGFQLGADDYVCKPFSIQEFKYRIEAYTEKILTTNKTGRRSTGAQSFRFNLDVNNLVLNSNGWLHALPTKNASCFRFFFRHCDKAHRTGRLSKKCLGRKMDSFVGAKYGCFLYKLSEISEQ
jgi:DNA-binding response OmpR family regulator